MGHEIQFDNPHTRVYLYGGCCFNAESALLAIWRRDVLGSGRKEHCLFSATSSNTEASKSIQLLEGVAKI